MDRGRAAWPCAPLSCYAVAIVSQKILYYIYYPAPPREHIGHARDTWHQPS